MAKSRNFSVRAQAIRALLERFSPLEYHFDFIGMEERHQAFFIAAEADIWLEEFDRVSKTFGHENSGFGDLDVVVPAMQTLVVTYNPRRTKSDCSVMSVFTADNRLKGFVFVEDDGRGSFFAVSTPGGTRVNPLFPF
jgi:hypothetical protein